MSEEHKPTESSAETPKAPALAPDTALIAEELRASGAPLDDRDAVHFSAPLKDSNTEKK